MILLDTNIISEIWKPSPDQRVIDWINTQAIETLYLSSVTVAELRFGIAVLPEGRRRANLDRGLEKEILPIFDGRVLAFDLQATMAYAKLMAQAKRAGQAISKADGYIAAIAAAHNLTVATRDVSPFRAAGLNVLDPWALC
ncbi:VapC toxin family PIN domain ribonuclease [Rhizobium rhizosphaerae]|uniref:Ribonuclease VapC n=1 Tax=Xaviernesmea rhizosphaerae TaxID=1672749 RepID=A0ABX3PAX0_9HYPH|nr:type II toxin-antitoxin system VapC family toxin [Xaviernesmea rhizosphaerae]OQP85565.1 VapC toxin family PIN domain ribonuclease [Xaviernesmea rhizosphaerae]